MDLWLLYCEQLQAKQKKNAKFEREQSQRKLEQKRLEFNVFHMQVMGTSCSGSVCLYICVYICVCSLACAFMSLCICESGVSSIDGCVRTSLAVLVRPVSNHF